MFCLFTLYRSFSKYSRRQIGNIFFSSLLSRKMLSSNEHTQTHCCCFVGYNWLWLTTQKELTLNMLGKFQQTTWMPFFLSQKLKFEIPFNFLLRRQIWMKFKLYNLIKVTNIFLNVVCWNFPACWTFTHLVSQATIRGLFCYKRPKVHIHRNFLKVIDHVIIIDQCRLLADSYIPMFFRIFLYFKPSYISYIFL